MDKITITDLLNLLYTDVDGHENDCDCNVCLTLDTVQTYIIQHRIDTKQSNMVG